MKGDYAKKDTSTIRGLIRPPLTRKCLHCVHSPPFDLGLFHKRRLKRRDNLGGNERKSDGDYGCERTRGGLIKSLGPRRWRDVNSRQHQRRKIAAKQGRGGNSGEKNGPTTRI